MPSCSVRASLNRTSCVMGSPSLAREVYLLANRSASGLTFCISLDRPSLDGQYRALSKASGLKFLYSSRLFSTFQLEHAGTAHRAQSAPPTKFFAPQTSL